MKRYIAAAAGALLAASVGGAAAAQTTIRLQEGFAPDPREVPVRAGGPRATTGITGCNGGYIAEQPSARVEWSGEGGFLILSAQSAADTTLVVRGPDGNTVCNDDSQSGGLNPELPLFSMAPGTYEVWVGRLGEPGDIQPATLRLSSVMGAEPQVGVPPMGGPEDMPAPPTPTAPPNPDARPGATLSLRAGFRPDPSVTPVQAGGPLIAGGVAGCEAGGFVSEAASVRLTYTGSGAPLVFSVASDADTTLVIRGPDGTWACNDDGPTGLEPQIIAQSAPAGRYDIYVGRFGEQGDRAPATLSISATVPPPPPVEPDMPMEEIPEPVAPTAPADPRLPATQGTVTFRGGSADLQRSIQAGGPLTAESIQGCYAGFVTAAPTATLTYTAASGPLVISADGGDQDVTLAVHTPDGGWICNDDGAAGLNPQIVFARPASGAYQVYVGRFGTQTATVPATLRFSSTVPPVPPMTDEGMAEAAPEPRPATR